MPSENKDRVSMPPALEPPPSPHSTASNTPTPLGILSTLPRELRDEIYGHVHDPTYLIYKYPHEMDFKWRSMNRHGDELLMITLSKAIHQEYLAILFEKAVFVLKNDIHSGGGFWESGQIPFIDQILNVRYDALLFQPGDIPISELSQILKDPRLAKKIMSERSIGGAKPVEFFTGTEVLRNSCFLELYSAIPYVIPLLESPLIMAIKGLTGFKTVTLKLELGVLTWSRETSLMFNGRGLSDAEYAEEFSGVANAFRGALEPSLGPSVGLGPIIIRDVFDIRLAWELTFRPQDYIANKNRAIAISSRLGDEGNGSFAQVGSS